MPFIHVSISISPSPSHSSSLPVASHHPSRGSLPCVPPPPSVSSHVSHSLSPHAHSPASPSVTSSFPQLPEVEQTTSTIGIVPSSHPSPPPLPPVRTHPMVTQLQHNITKPKVFSDGTVKYPLSIALTVMCSSKNVCVQARMLNQIVFLKLLNMPLGIPP